MFVGLKCGIGISVFVLLLTEMGGAFAQIDTFSYEQKKTAVDNESAVFLREFDREAAEMCNRVANVEWKYSINATDFNRRRMKEQQSVAAKFDCLSWRRAAMYDTNRIGDTNVRRQLNRIVRQGRCGLAEDKHSELTQIIASMRDNYNGAKVCPYVGGEMQQAQLSPISGNSASYEPTSTGFCDLKLDPDLLRIMEKSTSEDELRYVWSAWREQTGPPVKNSFMRYLDLANQAAQIHGFHDAGEQSRASYEDPDFIYLVQDLWNKVLPLHKQLVTFVRKGLFRKYGGFVVRPDGPLPAHILGNMWGQSWKNLFKFLIPMPHEMPDVTSEMMRQGFTPLRMFQTAEDFFTSLGMPPMLPEFWRYSMLQKPNDVYTQCTASAWDFCNNVDFRIKQCTQVTSQDLVNAHHEMTHIQYYMQYSEQPFVYREGPNPSFHEAIAHAVVLNVGGPVHLQRIGLIKPHISLDQGNSMIHMEYLLGLALDKLPFMAFSLALEKWRWYVFEKGPVGMNAKWWELQLRYQGIKPPVERMAEHFDAGAKYHVISDQEYIKYFVATILQFQVFEELCRNANHVGPLHTCDFYRSREAGRVLMEVMKQGAAMPPAQLIKLMTKGRVAQLSADPLIEFFKPLMAWLELQNKDEPVIGWNSNMADVALFQSGGAVRIGSTLLGNIVFLLFCKNLM